MVRSEGKSLLDRNHGVVVLEVQHASAHSFPPRLVLIAPVRIPLVEHVFIRFQVVNGRVLTLRIKEIKEFAVREALALEVEGPIVPLGIGVLLSNPLAVLRAAAFAQSVGSTERDTLLVLASDHDLVVWIGLEDNQTLLNDLRASEASEEILHHRALSGGRFSD